MFRCFSSRFGLFFIVFALLVIAALGVFFFKYDRLQSLDRPLLIRFHKGESLRSLSQDLYQKRAISSPGVFYYQARLLSSPSSFRFGEYQLTSGMSVRALFSHLIAGKVVIRHFTIIDGWTLRQLLSSIRATQAFERPNFSMSDLAVMFPGQQDLEGRFYPDTYQYYWGQKPRLFLKESHQKMQALLSGLWAGRKPGLPYKTPLQALTAASLIQKETMLARERPLIAQVIINRLKKKMRLQIDPTVLYALGINRPKLGRVTYKMLRVDSPYNTYKHKGLPPGPICMPSAGALEAVFHPVHTDALFYVATGEGGGHTFTKTFEGHKKAVRVYRKVQAARALP